MLQMHVRVSNKQLCLLVNEQHHITRVLNVDRQQVEANSMSALVSEDEKLVLSRDDVVDVAYVFLLVQIDFQALIYVYEKSLILLTDDEFSQVFAKGAKLYFTIIRREWIPKFIDFAPRITLLRVIESK